MIQPNNRRSRFWVDPAFQGKLVGAVIGTALGTLVTYFVSQRFLFWRIEQLAMAAGLPAHGTFLEDVGRARFLAQIAMVASTFLIMGFWSTFVVFLSHRVIGPIRKLKWFLVKVARGDEVFASRLTFREHDHFQELPDLLHGALARQASDRVENRQLN